MLDPVYPEIKLQFDYTTKPWAENGLFLTDFELTTGGPRAETQAGQGIHQRGGAHGAHPHQGAAGADR